MQLTDTHIHLNSAEFDSIRQDLIDSCEKRNIFRFIIPDVNLSTHNLNYTSAFSKFYYAIGVHPFFICSSDRLTEQLVDAGRYIAVGEIGIDLRKKLPELPDVELQINAFKEQADIAKNFNLPLIVHCVHAHDLTTKKLKKMNFRSGGIVHGFTGSCETAREWIKLGFKLGIGTAAAAARGDRLRRVIGSIGIENIVLETDAPNPRLSPEFKDSIPECMMKILSVVSGLYHCDINETAYLIEENINRTFLI